MKRKTYGVSGLMDWTTQIKAGKGSVSVHFTGGALTAYGVTPAKFSTSNPFFQNVIENSEHFKSGRIELLGEMEVPDDAATKARKARIAARLSEHQEETSKTSNTTSPVTGTDETKEIQSVHEVQEEGQNAISSVSDVSYAKCSKVEVADKYDAIEYLKEHFPEKNYTATGLRTKTAFEAACNECGVEFVFTT